MGYTVTLPCEPGTTVYVLDKSKDTPMSMWLNHFEIHRRTGVWAKLIDSPAATKHTIIVNIRAFGKQVFLNKHEAEAAINDRR